MSVEVPYKSSGFREVGDFILDPVDYTGFAIYRRKQGIAPLDVRRYKPLLHHAMSRHNFSLHKDSPDETAENSPLIFYMNALEKISVSVEPQAIIVSSVSFDESNADKVFNYRMFLGQLESVIKEDLPKHFRSHGGPD